MSLLSKKMEMKRLGSERGFVASELGDHSEDEAVRCKGCGAIHYIKGFEETATWHFDDEECTSVSVYCISKAQAYHYRYMEDIVLVSGKLTADLLENKISELEDRIHALERKTEELPRDGGIRKLKDEIEDDFARAMEANKRKEKQSG